VHGSTKFADVFDKLQDLKTVKTTDNLDKNGNIFHTQDAGSTKNGTKFKQVNDQKVKE